MSARKRNRAQQDAAGRARQQALAAAIERKEAEEARRRLQRQRDELLARLQLQFQRMPIACIIFDPAGHVIDWNPAAERTFGFTREEVIGIDFQAMLVPASSRKYTQDIHRRVAAGDMQAHGLNENVTRDGRSILCEWCNTPLRNAQGGVIAILSTAQDVTERRQAVEKLKRSESRLAEAQRIAHIGSWNWDLQSGALEWSDEQYRIFGLKPQEPPITLERAFNLVHPDDRTRVQDSIAQAIRDRRPNESSHRLILDDGTIRIVQSRRRPVLDEGGKPIGMFGTVQDITEAKRAEEALRGSEERVRLLLESTAEAIYGIDIEGNCTFSNPACLRLLGYRDPGDLLGKPMHELIHHTRLDGSPYPREACPILRAFLRDEEVHTDNEMLWRADGTSFPAEYWSHPIRREGQIVGAVVTFLDITERKRLEKEILEVSERERRRIGQDLHDDLCQQLTGIAFTGRLLQQRLAARSVPEAGVAEKIVQAVQHATARARDLAKGLHPVRLEADGLAAALRELARTLESVFQISCRFQCRAGRQSVRVADPAVAIQLYRVAQEAATNAVRHGKAKDICISIGVTRGRMKLAIADDGVGIAAAPHHHGMGLPVMYQRARVIGAALTISPRRKGGTLVTCSLQGRPSVPTTEREAVKQASRRAREQLDRRVSKTADSAKDIHGRSIRRKDRVDPTTGRRNERRQ